VKIYIVHCNSVNTKPYKNLLPVHRLLFFKFPSPFLSLLSIQVLPINFFPSRYSSNILVIPTVMGTREREDSVLALSAALPTRDNHQPPSDAHELAFFRSSSIFYHVLNHPNIICKSRTKTMARRQFEVDKRVFDRLGHHPHIVEMVGTPDPAIYLEETRLSSLRAHYAWGGHPTVAERLAWCRDIAVALAFAHDQGVRHSGLSCLKVLLAEDGSVRLCGFGGASVDGSRPRAFPESASRHPARAEYEAPTAAAELHALASTLFEVLTGARVHAEAPAAERFLRLARGEYPAVGHLVLGEALEKCWRGEYATAREAAREIAGLGAFRSTVGCAEPRLTWSQCGSTTRPSRPRRRAGRTAACGAAARCCEGCGVDSTAAGCRGDALM
jgi:hypothetical protein